MNQTWITRISRDLSAGSHQVKNTLELLGDGATIPFIARYRKERTGSLDETVIEAIEKAYKALVELEQRKKTVLSAIEEQGALTAELERAIADCYDAGQLEDLYLPYKKKRETKASKARAQGLEPLADAIEGQRERNVRGMAGNFTGKEVADADAAIQGALWIIAERMAEDQRIREAVRGAFREHAVLEAREGRGAGEEAAKFRDYFGHSERLQRIPSHRLLAILRGEAEGALQVKLGPDYERTLARLQRLAYDRHKPSADLLQAALEDSYKRLLAPSIETETRKHYKAIADAEAIAVFANNLGQLLMAAPLGARSVLAIDPGFRTGCKAVILDAQGGLLDRATLWLHTGGTRKDEASQQLEAWQRRYGFEAVAVGDGTAGQETVTWLRGQPELGGLDIFPVDESGASIYSASAVAREEFPELDLTYRGAVSIGRRLQDPMAELIKIDPKSIGVGQYQHDVDQKALREELERTLIRCVHEVGVRLNTASRYLLAYLGGVGPALAEEIVKYRETHGPFRAVGELLQVPRFGPKAFELAAGFLRIPDSVQPLDNTGVHPESYPIAERMARDLGVGIPELLSRADLREKINPERYVTEAAGLPTIRDILKELARPGLDPRGEASHFSFDKRLKDFDDVREGMWVKGVVTNVTKFGAFVDIGIKENGLIHVSQLANRFISDPAEVVQLRQVLDVRVVSIDRERRRIALSLLEG